MLFSSISGVCSLVLDSYLGSSSEAAQTVYNIIVKSDYGTICLGHPYKELDGNTPDARL